MSQININQGKPLSPQQVVSQWKVMPNKLAVNIWNFEVKAGKAAQKILKNRLI